MSVNTDLIQTIGKYVICVVVLVGCFALLAPVTGGDPTNTQPWTVVGLIVGWIVRDSAGQSATTNAVKTLAATQTTNG